jgi:4-amino-4-deoxy-L-arabinose transferase-like glycosyltransferase
MWLGRRGGDLAPRSAVLAASLLALAVVHACARAEYGPTTALVATGLLGLAPAFWRWTAMLMTEIPYLAFFTAAVACFYRGLYRSPRFFYWSWLCWALAVLTRYSAGLFVPIAILFLAVAAASRDGDALGRARSRAFVLGPLVALAVVGPWLIRQYVVFGDALVGFEQASTQLQLFLPGQSMPWYFYLVQAPAMVSLVPAVLFALGAWWAVRRRDRFALHCLLVCVTIVVWFSGYRFKEVRQITSILPFLAIVAALGTTRILIADPPTWRSWATLATLLVAVSATSGVHTRAQLAGTAALGYPSFLDAMRFLRERTAPGALVAGANYPQIHWYADRRAIDLPDERDFRPVLERAEWVVVTNFERGQPAYARDLLGKVTSEDVRAGDAAIFRDRWYFTALIRSGLLRERLRVP